MPAHFRNAIVLGTFALVALTGLLVSYTAPYIASSDELVYLTGALQAREHTLPDAYMLQGMDFGPYLYPRVLSAEYESLGYYTFKSIYLVVLIFATGLAAYAMFRLLGLAWIPSLLFSVVALMPRFASGQELFGILTFKEAIGRASALPLFFLGTGFLIKRLMEGKSLWPIFGVFGLLLFLHPVTVILFAFISLIAVAVMRTFQRASVGAILRDVIVSGLAFVLAGSYFFVQVLVRLAHGVASEGVSASLYVQAIVFRNAWEFPAGVMQWYPHMAIVSAFFIIVLAAYAVVPSVRSLRGKYPFPYAKELIVWGLTVAVGSVACGLAIPGLNLYFMEHADAPYIFQQWSRLAKFYYFGLFVALVPMLQVLWQKYLESQWRFKRAAVALLFIAGVLSSSVAFEVAQFAVGYKNFEKAYIPQTLSHLPDDITPTEYRETCSALAKFGATSATLVISNDFSFRYYCKAHLYETNEEGSAYQQLLRSDVVLWYTRLQAQRTALGTADPRAMRDFARSVGGAYIIVPRTPKYQPLEALKNGEVDITSRHIIMRVAQ